MPILFVHGVASRIKNGHDKTWATVQNNLRTIVAPQISKYGRGDNVWIEEAYWGDAAVDFGDLRLSLPTPERIRELQSRKSGWLERKFQEFENLPNTLEDLPNTLKFAQNFFSKAPEKLWDLPGYQLTRHVSEPFRPKLNQETTLFLGDIFHYLSRRGEVNNLGAITSELLSKLKEAHKNKRQRDNEPLIVISHSMGGQLVYDMVTHYLPEMAKLPQHQDCQNIHIDFWVAAGSQVGLFKEMKVFKEDINSRQASLPAPFPSKHLGIWWNLWDSNDYLSFTVAPFVEGVFDDMYDSGKSAITSHTAHFEDKDFYQELALHISNAQKSDWKRQDFMKKLTIDYWEHSQLVEQTAKISRNRSPNVTSLNSLSSWSSLDSSDYEVLTDD